MSTKSTMNDPKPQIISLPTGRIGFGAFSSLVLVLVPPSWASNTSMPCVADTETVTVAKATASPLADGSGVLEQDEDHEADQGQRLGEGDAEEHRGAHQAGRLGLAGHGLDGLADDVADADAGADGGQAVGETGAGGGSIVLGIGCADLSKDRGEG